MNGFGELDTILAKSLEMIAIFVKILTPGVVILWALSRWTNNAEAEAEDKAQENIPAVIAEPEDTRSAFSAQVERIEAILKHIRHSGIYLQGKELVAEGKKLLSALADNAAGGVLEKLESYYMPETISLLGKFEGLEKRGALKRVNIGSFTDSLKTTTKVIRLAIEEVSEPDVMELNVGADVLVNMAKLSGLDDGNPFSQKSA